MGAQKPNRASMPNGVMSQAAGAAPLRGCRAPELARKRTGDAVRTVGAVVVVVSVSLAVLLTGCLTVSRYAFSLDCRPLRVPTLTVRPQQN